MLHIKRYTATISRVRQKIKPKTVSMTQAPNGLTPSWLIRQHSTVKNICYGSHSIDARYTMETAAPASYRLVPLPALGHPATIAPPTPRRESGRLWFIPPSPGPPGRPALSCPCCTDPANSEPLSWPVLTQRQPRSGNRAPRTSSRVPGLSSFARESRSH